MKASQRKRKPSAEFLNLRKLIKLAEMKVLRVESDDVLVMQTDLCLDKDQVEALRDRAHEQISRSTLRDHTVMILTAGLKMGVLRKRKRSRT